MTIDSARPTARRLPIGKILQFDYNFFYATLVRRATRRILNRGSPTTENTFVVVVRGRGQRGADVKLISNVAIVSESFRERNLKAISSLFSFHLQRKSERDARVSPFPETFSTDGFGTVRADNKGSISSSNKKSAL